MGHVLRRRLGGPCLPVFLRCPLPRHPVLASSAQSSRQLPVAQSALCSPRPRPPPAQQLWSSASIPPLPCFASSFLFCAPHLLLVYRPSSRRANASVVSVLHHSHTSIQRTPTPRHSTPSPSTPHAQKPRLGNAGALAPGPQEPEAKVPGGEGRGPRVGAGGARRPARPPARWAPAAQSGSARGGGLPAGWGLGSRLCEHACFCKANLKV